MVLTWLEEGERICATFDVTDPQRLQDCCLFLCEAMRLPEDGLADTELGNGDVIIGFDIGSMFRVLASQMWDAGFQVPPRFWLRTPGLIDIYDQLLPSPLRNGFDLLGLLQFHQPRILPLQERYGLQVSRHLGSAQQAADTALALAAVSGLLEY